MIMLLHSLSSPIVIISVHVCPTSYEHTTAPVTAFHDRSTSSCMTSSPVTLLDGAGSVFYKNMHSGSQFTDVIYTIILFQTQD